MTGPRRLTDLRGGPHQKARNLVRRYRNDRGQRGELVLRAALAQPRGKLTRPPRIPLS